jgi:hypothetical protein
MTQLAKSMTHIRYELNLKDIWAFWNLAMEQYWEVKDILTDFWYEERDGNPIDSNIKAAMESELVRREVIVDLISEEIDRLEKELGIVKSKPRLGPKK